MGVSCKVGAFSTGTGAVDSTQDVTCGFQPKAIIFWWSGHTSSTDSCTFGDSKMGVGFGTQTERGCVTSTDDNGAGSQGASSGVREDACIASLTVNSTTWDGLIDLDALANWPSDGFRLIVDDVMPIDMRVSFIAFGGSDITNVDLHRYSELAGATGTFDIAITGAFQPDIVFFTNWQGTTNPPQAGGSTGHFCFGAARTGSEAAILYGATDAGSASSDTASYCTDVLDVTGLESLTDPTALSISRVAFVQMNSDGFRLNKVAFTGVNTFQAFALCIKGGLWKINPITTLTNTTNDITISGIGGTPKGVIVASAARAESAAGTPTAPWHTSIGAATSTSERTAQAVISSSGDANMRVIRAVETDEIYINIQDPGSDGADGASGTVQGLMDVQSVDADGFSFRMDDADPSGCFAWTVMIGEAAAAAPKTAPGFLRFAHHPRLRYLGSRRSA
jgi:hypothetical protein